MIKVFWITTKILTKDDDADLSSNLLMEEQACVREVCEKKLKLGYDENKSRLITILTVFKTMGFN